MEDIYMENQLPSEYEDVVRQIAEALDSGFACFLNPKTLEIEQVLGAGLFDASETEIDEQNEDMIDEYGLDYPEWESFIRFEPFDRDSMVGVIEAYVDRSRNEELKSWLEHASDEEELVSQIDEVMRKLGYLEGWRSFKKKEIERYVVSQLIDGLKENRSTDEDIYSLST